MADLKLYESEYRFMDLIWEAEPVRSTELAKIAGERLEWKKSTCYTVLKKLETKGFVKNEDATVTSLIGREQVQRAESSQLIERSFGGSLPAFLNAFLTGRRLTAEEARELHRLIEEAAPETGSLEEERGKGKGGSV
ncbi:MAG: BlaI/MecI/CopY family transcriptional regulator [Sakamotonia sp.]|jgi:BlaI family penicillinase repressor